MMQTLKLYGLYLFCLLIRPEAAFCQDATDLVQKVKAKLDQVNDYQADGTMKTNVSFLKVPQAQVKVYFRKPDNFRIRNDQGISLVPKGAVSISLNNLMKGRFTALDMGTETADGQKVRVIKLLPADDNGEIVLSTLYVDEGRLLILKARTTTRESGTYEVDMYYGKYAAYALPDRIVFTFNTKDYKLPKGITFDYDDGSRKNTENKVAETKGRVEIIYHDYLINKGVPDALFH